MYTHSFYLISGLSRLSDLGRRFSVFNKRNIFEIIPYSFIEGILQQWLITAQLYGSPIYSLFMYYIILHTVVLFRIVNV